jgi:hypothetical protein
LLGGCIHVSFNYPEVISPNPIRFGTTAWQKCLTLYPRDTLHQKADFQNRWLTVWND